MVKSYFLAVEDALSAEIVSRRREAILDRAVAEAGE
jgi:hypothetical protein